MFLEFAGFWKFLALLRWRLGESGIAGVEPLVEVVGIRVSSASIERSSSRIFISLPK
jgi:hypothetical protein